MSDDWYAEYRRRLLAGDETPLPHDPEWWDAWQRRINDAPAWRNANDPEPKGTDP